MWEMRVFITGLRYKGNFEDYEWIKVAGDEFQ
jgi:hypothetical protein